MGNKSNTVKRKKDYNEYTVMLVGKMGAGKSSLGNFLLQREAFVTGDDMARVTNDNRCESRMITDKIKLRIIDTPGFGDFREQEKVRDDVANAFYEAKDGVDAFIFVISSHQTRIGIGRNVGTFMFNTTNTSVVLLSLLCLYHCSL